MKRKSIALLLVAAMCTAALSGCGKSADSNPGPKATTAPVADVVVSGKVNGLLYKEGLPLVDEGTYGFSMFVDDSEHPSSLFLIQ